MVATEQGKLKGLVTYGPRQSLTSFAAALGELRALGVGIELAPFAENPQRERLAALAKDVRLVVMLVLKRWDFVILNSGASLIARPHLLRALLRLLAGRGIPVFMVWHNVAEKFTVLQRRLGTHPYRQTLDAIKRGRIVHLAVSHKSAQDVMAELDEQNVGVVWNCQTPPDSPMPAVPVEPPLIFNAASVIKRKGPDLFVRIAALVAKQRMDVRFVWSGGEATDELQALVRSLGIEKIVSFIGFYDRVYDYMNEASLLLLPSRDEAFGLVAVEAMACYRTVVYFASNGIAEVVGDTGCCAPVEDVAQAARFILAQLDRPAAERINQLARLRYDELFTPKVYAARFASIIRHHLQSR